MSKVDLKRTRKRSHICVITILIVMIATANISSQKINAYGTFGYNLKGQWSYDYYWVSPHSVTYNGVTRNYAPMARDAVKYWNETLVPSPAVFGIHLTETTNNTSSKLRALLQYHDHGPTGYRGITYYHDYDPITKTWKPLTTGQYPKQNYYAGTAIVNVYYVHSDPYYKVVSTMMHELGHVWGLGHSSVSGALMTGSGTGIYTSLKKPQADDINGVRYIYRHWVN